MNAPGPSLTPHRDAALAGMAGLTPPADPFMAAIARVNNAATLEIADIMDAGKGGSHAADFAISVAASVLDTIACSAAAGDPHPVIARGAILGGMLRKVALTLAVNAPFSTVKADVHHAPEGTA